MKFEFELDGYDVEELLGLFQSKTMKLLTEIIDWDDDEEKQCRIPYNVDHIKHIENLQETIFGDRGVSRMNLRRYTEKYGEAEYSED